MFKSVLTDIIYSFRMSMKKLTGSTADVKLNQIRIKQPIEVDGLVVVGNIRNLVGGKLSCAFDNNLVEFLNNESNYVSDRFSPTEMFAIDLFDCFTSTSKNGLLELNTNNIKTRSNIVDSIYYIKFDTRILTNRGNIIPSKFVVSVDEIASMYFRD